MAYLLRRDGEKLRVRSPRKDLDTQLAAAVRASKPALLELVDAHTWWSAPPRITPELLSLVELPQSARQGWRPSGGWR